MARVGRPERPLNPGDGPLEALARGLRELRSQAGNPSYRVLSRRAHYSRTVLSDAAGGERLPTLPVTLAYVAACGGDVDEWRARWHLCHQQINAVHPRPAAPGNGPAAAPGNSQAAAAGPANGQAATPTAAAAAPGTAPEAGTGLAPRMRSGGGYRNRAGARAHAFLRRVTRPAVLVMCGIVVLTQVEAVVIWHAARAPAPPPAKIKATAFRVQDGTDPKIANCGADAVDLDRRAVRLPVATVISGRRFPVGTVLGVVSLRYSAHCAGAWARFDPAPEVYGDNPGVAAVLLQVSRPADGTQSTWRLPHVDEAYGDLLLTGLGCVTARASVQFVGQRVSATAQTRCLPHI